MSEDATLDAFGGAEGAERDEGPEPEAGVEEGGDGDDEIDRLEPPTLTYTSSPDGDDCAECGETVQHRWHAGEGAEDPDALVCPNCKSW